MSRISQNPQLQRPLMMIFSEVDRSSLLTATELVKRWEVSLYPVSPLTLARWRRRGYGPQFIKIGAAGRVFYSLESIQQFEEEQGINLTKAFFNARPQDSSCAL